MSSLCKISVVRHSFFVTSSRGHLRWTEASPTFLHVHEATCGCTTGVDTRPTGQPEQIRQEVRIAWDDCLIQLEKNVAEPWVSFRRAGDTEAWINRQATKGDCEEARIATFWFEAHQHGVKLEVPSPGFGLIGVVFAHVYLGNQVDISRFHNGWQPSRVVNLADISQDQVWLHVGHWDAMHFLKDPEEAQALRSGFALAREVREHAQVHVLNHTAEVDDIRAAVEADTTLIAAATNLRQLLQPFAFDVERTELFRRAKEIEGKEERQWSSRT